MRVYLVDLESGNLRSVAQAVHRVAGAAGDKAALEVGRDPVALAQAERIILPGVGAFPALASRLFAEAGLVATLQEKRHAGVPILGICVGMQLMADLGLEHGETRGLGWIGGQVEALAKEGTQEEAKEGAKEEAQESGTADTEASTKEEAQESGTASTEAGTENPADRAVRPLRVPRMGWSLVTPSQASPLLNTPEWFYFAHGYGFRATDAASVLATTSHACLGDTPALIGEAVSSDRRVWGAQFHPEKSGAAGMAFLAKFLSPTLLD